MLKQIGRIDRLHNLIKRGATGSPKQCAYRIGISERQLYNIIELMKDMGAPINYNVSSNTYYYAYEVDWDYRFTKKLSEHAMSTIKGSGIFSGKNCSLKYYFSQGLYY